MKLTHKGKTLRVTEWAMRTGLTPSAITHRIDSGWSVADTLETPLNLAFTVGAKKVTKNEAEILLNDMSYDQLPIMLAALIPDSSRGLSAPYGRLIRDNHRALFDIWFEKEYKPKKL